MGPAVPLMLGLLGAPSVQDERSQFFEALHQRDEGGLRSWYEANPAQTFERCTDSARRWLSHSDPSSGEAQRLRSEARFLADALAPAPPSSLLETVLAWPPEERELFGALARDLEEAARSLPESDELAFLLDEVERLQAGGLLLQPLSRIGFLLSGAGRDVEARELVRNVGELGRTHGRLWSEAWAEEWLARDAWEHGELHAAVDHFERSLELEGRLGNPVFESQVASELATVLSNLGRHTEGLERARFATDRARESRDPGVLRRAEAARASIHVELGELQTALDIALGVSPASGAEVPEDEAQVRLDLMMANILSDVGRLESALTYAQRAHRVSAGPEVSRLAPLLHCEAQLALGLLLGDVGRGAEGLEHLDRAQAALEREGDPRGVGWAHKNRGWILLDRGNASGAQREFERGQAQGAASGSPFLEAWCALGWLEAAARAGDWKPQEARARTALAARRAEELQDLHLSWRLRAVQGEGLVLAGQPAAALREFSAAVERIERWRRRLESPALLTHSLRNKIDPYRRATALAARQELHAQALFYSDLTRSRTLYQLRGRRPEAGRSEIDPRVRDLRRQLVSLDNRWRNPSARASASSAALARERLSIEAELDAVLMESSLRAGREPLASALPELDEERAQSLRRSAGMAAIVSFQHQESETIAIVLDADGLRSVVLPVPHAELRALAERLRAPLEELQRGSLDVVNLGFDAKAARRLHELLWEPLDLPSGRLGLLVDAPLAQVPFELFVCGGTPGPVHPDDPFQHYASLRTLDDEHTFTYLSSFEALAYEAPQAQAPGPPLLFAAPPAVGVPSAPAEIEALRTQRPDAQIHARASVEEFLEHAPGAGSLHVIAHGWVDPQFGAHSHFDLAGGRLEAWQIEELHLPMPIAVLSACHSAQGTWAHGEGLLGLTRSFLAAGVESVVASQWAVEDRATAALMEFFYDARGRGLGPDAALAKARSRLRTSRDPRGFSRAHPYFWAAWTLQR